MLYQLLACAALRAVQVVPSPYALFVVELRAFVPEKSPDTKPVLPENTVVPRLLSEPFWVRLPFISIVLVGVISKPPLRIVKLEVVANVAKVALS